MYKQNLSGSAFGNIISQLQHDIMANSVKECTRNASPFICDVAQLYVFRDFKLLAILPFPNMLSSSLLPQGHGFWRMIRDRLRDQQYPTHSPQGTRPGGYTI